MNLLEFFFIISGIVILIISIDIANKQKFNALHFLVFIWIGWGLLTFTFFPWILNVIWNFFGLARWADVLVYSSIIFLLYFVLLLLAKVVDNKEAITSVVREWAINHSGKRLIKWKEVILIRVYNEAPVIDGVLKRVLAKWYENILVINDWSTDFSREILEGFGDTIYLVNHPINRWAWAALKTGLEYIRRFADVEYIVTFDADWQHEIEDLEKFFNSFKMDNKLWAVLWSRFIQKTHSNVPFIRRCTLFLWRIFTFLVSNVYLTDAHNWYRVFTYDTISKIRLTIDTMAYASELIDELRKNNIKIKEVPVNIKYTEYSMNKWQGSWNAISIALRIIWSKFFR